MVGRPGRDALISRDRAQNLSVLSAARRVYFQDKLPVILLGTRLSFVSPDNRLPAVREVLPMVPEQERGVLSMCLSDQEKHAWDLRPDQSPWSMLRGPFPYGVGHANIDNLTSVDYTLIFSGAGPSPPFDSDKLLAGIEDYLANDFAMLEELRLALDAEARRSRDSSIPPVRRVLAYSDLQMHLHLTTAIVRLRAGWDKIANNVLRVIFDSRHLRNWPDNWSKRVSALDRAMLERDPQVRQFWEDWKRNAEQITMPGGLRSLRDNELHYWGVRTRETFGSRPTDVGLAELKQLALVEQDRVKDVWLLTLAITRHELSQAFQDGAT